jgi:hypothetical protein
VAPEHQSEFVGAALHLLSTAPAEDLDTREKALLALKSLIYLGGEVASDALAEEGGQGGVGRRGRLFWRMCARVWVGGGVGGGGGGAIAS